MKVLNWIRGHWYSDWVVTEKAARMGISALDFQPWPFTVSIVTLCHYRDAVWIELDGDRYELNGMAESLFAQRRIVARDLKDIWRLDPDWPPPELELDEAERERAGRVYINIGPLIRKGLTL